MAEVRFQRFRLRRLNSLAPIDLTHHLGPLLRPLARFLFDNVREIGVLKPVSQSEILNVNAEVFREPPRRLDGRRDDLAFYAAEIVTNVAPCPLGKVACQESADVVAHPPDRIG